MLIKNFLVREGGWVKKAGVTTFNFYHPPTLKHGDRRKAGMWLELVKKVYPDDWRRIVTYCAHYVQKPQVKINHGLLMGGAPGIGKDLILVPLQRALGPWNFSEVSPQQILGRFNGFLKSVLMRVSEVRDLGEFNRFQFYEHCKVFLAAPPEMLRVDEKNTPEHYVLNCVGAIFTSNHLSDGVYLPADDRRHDVMWSELTQEDFEDGYWKRLYKFYDSGGDGHVAAYLRSFDLSKFDPKAPPVKTAAFWTIVDSNRAPEEAELMDVLDRLENPAAVTLEQVTNNAGFDTDFEKWLKDRRNRRAIPHRFEKAGYVPVRNDARGTGLWVIGGVRQVVYARNTLSIRDRLKAVTDMQRGAAEKQAQREAEVKERAVKAGEKRRPPVNFDGGHGPNARQ